MTYQYNVNNQLSPEAFIPTIIFCLVIGVLQLVGQWKTFVKAGKPGWAALIPFYNEWTMFEIGGVNGAFVFFILIPFVGSFIYLVFEIKALLEIAKRFGKSVGFGVLSIFFPFVTFLILGLSDAKYNK